jgi:CRP/FNR family transcriptional regulator, cyclic AMP receptor protein
MSVRADAETLRQIPLFRNCDPVALQILAFSAERLVFDMDDVIFSAGEISRGAFLVLSGSISIVVNNKIAATIEEGALLGETAMIGGVPYSITARARDAVSVARIDRSVFMRVAGEYPEFGRSVLNALGSKLGDSVRDFDRVRLQLSAGKNFSQI